MKQIQQEQAPLKYNQTIPRDKTQTEVGFIIMNVNENSITVKYSYGLEISVPYHTAGKNSVKYYQEKISEMDRRRPYVKISGWQQTKTVT